MRGASPAAKEATLVGLLHAAMFALLLVLAGVAHADERADSMGEGESAQSAWISRRTAVDLHIGIGTPVGYVGATLDYAVVERLSASFGLGLGSGREGGSLHLALGTMFRALQYEQQAVYIGIDYSTGGWASAASVATSEASIFYGTKIFATRMHWLQGSLGLELRDAKSGFVLRPYVGIAAMLNPDSRRCVNEHTHAPCLLIEDDFGSTEIPVFGLALGYAE